MPLFASRAAFAETPSPVDLRWEAPARCPSQRVVMDRIRALAGSTAGTHGPIRADARVDNAGHGERGALRLTLTVRYGHASGTRVITSSSCDDLAGSTAVAISLLLGDSGGEAGPPAPAPAPSEPGATSAAPAGGSAHPPPSHSGPAVGGAAAATAPGAAGAASAAASAGVASGPNAAGATHGGPADARAPGHSEETRPAARRWHIDVRAPTLLVDVGSLPHPDLGFGAAASFGYDAFRVALGGTIWLSQTATSNDGPSPAAVGLDRWSLDLAGCRAWPAGVLEVAPCVSFSLDDVSARGNGPQVNPVSTQTTWVSVGPEVLGSLHLTDYAALVLGVSARWALSQPRFIVAGLGEIYQVPPVAAEALLGCDWIL
jgi:hypothetical protein